MNDTLRPPVSPSPEALLRYAVLAQIEAFILGGGSVGAAVRTLQRWRAAYAAGGLEALEPKSRRRTLTSVALSESMVAFLGAEKERDPRASVPELIRRAQARSIIPADLPVDRTTVWRACRPVGLPTRSRPSKREVDMRRWMYPHRGQCVLSDGKHFRAGAARLRRVALFFLDSATRYGMDVVVGTSESTTLFLGGLYSLVTASSPSTGYRTCSISTTAPASLRATLTPWSRAASVPGSSMARPSTPQGRGAIERFHRTAHDQVLRPLDGAADVDPDPAALTLRLGHFLDRYNDTPHETLGGGTSPSLPRRLRRPLPPLRGSPVPESVGRSRH